MTPPEDPDAPRAIAMPFAGVMPGLGKSPAAALDDYVIAIPAYNEELTIGSVVLRASQHGRTVVVVDDGSKDRTVEIATRAGARVIARPENGGYGETLRTVLQLARDEKWNALVLLDSDGQHDPDDVPAVIAPVLDGRADISIGSRFLEKRSQDAIPAYRQVGIQVLTRLSNLGADASQKVSDGQSGFRAFSRKAIASIPPRDTALRRPSKGSACVHHGCATWELVVIRFTRRESQDGSRSDVPRCERPLQDDDLGPSPIATCTPDSWGACALRRSRARVDAPSTRRVCRVLWHVRAHGHGELAPTGPLRRPRRK